MPKLMLSYLFKTNLSAFRSAILEDNTDKICRILDIERDYLHKYIDTEGNTPLILAIEYASPLTVRLLLEQGAHPDQPNRRTFQTPLTIVASKIYENSNSNKAQKALEFAKILLDYNAYIDKPSPCIYDDKYTGKETPLMTAVRKKNVPMVKLFIQKNANINYIERQLQIQPIHHAITNGDEIMFDLLNNAGALSSSIICSDNNSLLHWFCSEKDNDKHMSLLNKLINIQADIDIENSNHYTPLMIAVKNNMINTCRMLLNNGANMNKTDLNGNQIIDLSIPGSECAKLIIQHINIQNSKIKSPNTPSNTIRWKQRLNLTRRFTTELNDLNDNRKTNQYVISKDSVEKEMQHNTSVYRNTSPIPRRIIEGINTRYELLREKLIQTGQKRRNSKVNKQQMFTIFDENASPL